MRKMLNTLFVISEDYYLSLENENISILDQNGVVGKYPLILFENIISFTYKGASPALMGECAKRGIGLSFMSPNGKFLARCVGSENGNVLLRKKQYRISDNEEDSCKIARNMIYGKVHNARWTLERAIRDHAMRLDVSEVKNASVRLKNLMKEILEAENLDSLRGLEGTASMVYFSVFNQLILNQRADFVFENRSRRPPLDRVNALLSFLYVLLANQCASSLESAGLDAYVGFLHRDRPGRTSLALDMMEELRSVYAERTALSLINNRAINQKHFVRQESGAVLLNDEGRKVVLSAWQEKKKEVITHPFLKEKMPWGLVPYVQALLLARHLRGDLDGYPVFLWK